MFYIYYLFDPNDSLPFYIGYTKDYTRRLKSHVKEVNQLINTGKCASNNTLKVGTIKKIIDAGRYPVIKVIESVEDFNKVRNLEIEHISKYGLRILNTGILTNMTLGGDGSLGKKKDPEVVRRQVATRITNGNNKHTEETKKLLSKVRTGYKTGKPAWNTGKTKDTDESLKKMSNSLLGNIPWNKDIDKNDPRRQTGERNSFFGKTHDVETRAHMSEIAKSRPKYECCYCGKLNNINNHNRWHNDNCKKK